MIDRRGFLALGGAAALGLALPGPPRAWTRRPVRTIRMWSDATGAAVGFDPVGLAVVPGTVVRWVLDSGIHSATAYHADLHDHPTRIPTEARPWDSGILVEPGAAYEARLEVPGVHDFYCLPHEAAGMVGRIVVGSPGEDFEVPARARPGFRPDGALPPAAALAAFPAVDRIASERVVRNRPPIEPSNEGGPR